MEAAILVSTTRSECIGGRGISTGRFMPEQSEPFVPCRPGHCAHNFNIVPRSNGQKCRLTRNAKAKQRGFPAHFSSDPGTRLISLAE